MRFRSIDFRFLRGILPFILILFSEMGFAQLMSNKIDVSLLYGSVAPFGKKAGQIDGISVPKHFASAARSQNKSFRVSYNYNKLFSFGLNIGQFSLENAKLKPSPETFDLIEISPVFTLKKKILTSLLEARFNLMPMISSYKSSIYMGDIEYKNSKSEVNWMKTTQLVPGMKASVGLGAKEKGPLGIMAECGVGFFRDNQKVTSEVTNSYFFAQIGISYSLFYNKRYYLYYE